MEKSVNGFSRNTVPICPPLEQGYGAVVVDVNGKEYVDCCSQTLNTNLGQCHPKITEAVITQAKKLTYASSRFSSDVAVKLVKKLVSITPKTLSKVNLKNVSGTSANEGAVKAARKRTGRQLLVSVMHSHLGQTLEMMRISGKHWNVSYIGDRRTIFLPLPYCFRCPFGKQSENCAIECLDPFDDAVRTHGGDLAAVIIEPILVDAGVIIPPVKYHRSLRERCTHYGLALIYDEVQTAFGWLGNLFAMDLFGAVPDILSLGKGIGAGFPLGAVILSEEYDVLDYGEHEITYGAHPLSCAAALAMIDYLEAGGLVEAREKGNYSQRRLQEIANKCSLTCDIRGIGLLIGMEICKSKTKEPDSCRAREIFMRLLDQGIIFRISKVGENNNILQFKPPLVITYDQLDYVFEKFEKILKTT